MKNYWYVAAYSKDLKEKPLACKILDEPIVLFRNKEGKASALVNRCPHRNVFLSKGRVISGNIQCPYHGWEYNSEGKCVFIPSLCEGEKIPGSAVAQNYQVIEQQNLIWVWLGDREPTENEKPFEIPNYNYDSWGYTWLKPTIIKNSVNNLIENFIDCSHTGYIHGGLFRTPASHLASTFIKRVNTGVVIDIDEETNNKDSVFAKILLGKDSKVAHQDQFILPSIVRVGYSIGEKRHIIGYQICTPVEDFVSNVFVCVTWKLGWLTTFIKPMVNKIGLKVLEQDIWILEDQAAIIKKYGEHFVSAPADTANNWIKATRQNARQGTNPPGEKERKVDFRL